MPNIDIPIPEEVKRALELPKCIDLKLPEPEELTIRLPTAGALKAINDISKGIPNDCSLTLSLIVQIAPLLASMDCLLKILGLLKPLIDVIKGLPFPPVKAIQDFLEAAKEIIPCFLVITPAGICPFIRDILNLVAKILGCLIQQMKSLVELMSGISISLQLAEANGNSELMDTLNCAQENAAITAQHLMQAFAPVGAVLDLLSPLLEIAGQSAITIPTMPPGADPEALNQAISVFEGLQVALQTIVDALPC